MTRLTLAGVAICAFSWACSDDAGGSGSAKTQDGSSDDSGGAPDSTTGNDIVVTDIAAKDAVANDIAVKDTTANDTAVSDTTANDIGSTSGADGAFVEQHDGTLDSEQPVTCSTSEWAKCNDGNTCTKDYCHVDGCHYFDLSDCGTCPLYSRLHLPSNGELRLHDAVMSGGLQIAVGQNGAGSSADPPFFIAREATGKLKWTLNYKTSKYTKLWSMAARSDNFLWLVGDREGVDTTDGVIIRLRKDGKASYEWTIKKDKHLTRLRGAAKTSSNGLIAAGFRVTAQNVPSGLIVWRGAEGGLFGPQEVATGSNRRLFDIEAEASAGSGNWAVGSNDADGSGLILHVSAQGKLVESSVKVPQKKLVLTRVANLLASNSGSTSIAAIGTAGGDSALVVGGAAGFVHHAPKLSAVGLFDEVTASGAGHVVVTGHSGSDPHWGGVFVAKIATDTGKLLWTHKLSGAPGRLTGLQRFAGGGYGLAGTLKGAGAWMMRVGADGSLKCPP